MREIAGVERKAKEGRETLRDSVAAYLDFQTQAGCSPETVNWYERRLRLFFSTLLDTVWPMEEVTDKVIISLAEAVRAKRRGSDVTYNGYLRAATAFLNWCSLHHRPHPANPKVLTKVKVDVKILDLLTEDELRRLLEAFDTDDVYGLRNRWICLLMVDTGMRISEALGVRLVDLDLPYICLTETKGNRDRTVGVTESVEADLKRWLKLLNSDDPNQYLFPSRYTPQLSKRQFTTELKRAAKRAGIRKNVYNHLMRHTYATMRLNAGMSLGAVQKTLGHRDISMTLKYARMRDETAIAESQESSPMNRINGKKKGTTLRGRGHRTD